MNLSNVRLHTTAVKPEQFPNTVFPEVAFVGRSNVGKSSLINSLLQRKKLAKTSAKPGRTRVINFYYIDNKMFLVDLPGYGYASVSKHEYRSWSKLIESYLYNRSQLKLLVMLVDIRRKPVENDLIMYNWISYYNIPHILTAAKSDKIGQQKILSNINTIRKFLSIDESVKIIPYSSVKNTGKDKLWKEILSSI